jgi:hypothetical protein
MLRCQIIIRLRETISATLAANFSLPGVMDYALLKTELD